MPSVRRVVTGHAPDGKAVFASDEQVEALTVGLYPGWEFFLLWGADEPPAFPDDGAEPPYTNYFPPRGGFRFSLSTIPPADTPPPTIEDEQAARREVEEKLPGMDALIEDDGMHTTASVDFEVVLKGEVILELDDGAERLLKPGDVVVQNGTRHRWRNETGEDVLLAVFMLGVERKA